MRIILSSILLFSLVFSNAQANQGEYLEAKRQFSLENYRDAMGGFQSLTDDPVFGQYASFYYALSAYHQELPKVAVDMWKQILVKYPNWNQLNEVNYWIARAAFERKRYMEGIRYSQSLPEDQRNSLIELVSGRFDPVEMKVLYNGNQENQELAKLVFGALLDQPYEERDHDLILDLANKFNFDPGDIIGDLPKVEKDTYGIALILPFMFDSLESPQSVIGNSIIFELYQGMELARDSLARIDINLEFYPYDTRKLGSKAYEITKEASLKNADLIIGPLLEDPNTVISSFSKEFEIPMINPLTSNGTLVGDNPFAFLFKPSYETQGRKAGEYAVNNFTRNKNAMILFETLRDQVVAEAYKKVLEADSFNIVLFDEISRESGLQLQYDWTQQYESVIDSLSQDEIDSISAIPNRYVRTRPKRHERTGRILKNHNGEDREEYYEMRFNIPQDTIGHIFAATSNSLLAGNIVNLTDVRGDSISVMGYDNWLDFKLMSYGQLERLGVSLIHTSYFDEERIEPFEDLVRRTFWTEPTEFHKLGFELVMQVGRLLKENGKHFQRGLLAGKYLEGYLMEGLMYGSYHDNQIVPIVTIEDLEIKVRN
ncbi:MAG: hypothetical protein RIM99_12645 [Cyclobacteriaceae bacterium]